MKRSYLYFVASALALTACTSENVLEDTALVQNVIGFENVVNKPSRAIVELDKGSLAKFNVFGYYTTPGNDGVAVPVFEDVTVTKQESGNWTYEGANRYWVPGAHYYFYAYSCGNVVKLNGDEGYGTFTMPMTNGLTPSQRVLTINNYLCDESHQHDLIFASNTGGTAENPFLGIEGKENGNARVALQFRHLLSKVQAQFTSNFPEGYTVTITNLTIDNIHNVGTYNPTDGWQNVAHKANQVSPAVKLLDATKTSISTTVGNEAAKSLAAFVLPYEYKEPAEGNDAKWVYLNFDLSVTNKGQEVLTKHITGHFNPNWEAGYTYTYNVQVDGDAANLEVIAFTTATDEDGGAVIEWTTGSTGNGITIE